MAITVMVPVVMSVVMGVVMPMVMRPWAIGADAPDEPGNQPTSGNQVNLG